MALFFIRMYICFFYRFESDLFIYFDLFESFQGENKTGDASDTLTGT